MDNESMNKYNYLESWEGALYHRNQVVGVPLAFSFRPSTYQEALYPNLDRDIEAIIISALLSSSMNTEIKRFNVNCRDMLRWDASHQTETGLSEHTF